MTWKIIVWSLMLCLLVACQSPTASNSKDMYQDIGQQIRTQRLAKGLSQQQLADEVGMTQNSLSLIEDGLATPIHTKIIAIQQHLDFTFQFNGPYKTIEEYLEAAQKEGQ